MNIETAEQMLTPAVRQALPYITGFLLLWFANMALTGWLAGRRGREDGLWTVFAMLAGPFALIILILLPRVAPEDAAVDVTWRPASPISGAAWPALPAPPDPISTRERLLAAGLGAVLGAAGAAVAAGAGDTERLALVAMISGGAGWLVGYWVAGTLLDADRNKRILVGLGSGVLILSVNAILTALIAGVPAVIQEPSSLIAVLFGFAGAVLFPLVTPISYPGLLALALAGGVTWALSTPIVVLRMRRARSVAGSAAAA